MKKFFIGLFLMMCGSLAFGETAPEKDFANITNRHGSVVFCFMNITNAMYNYDRSGEQCYSITITNMQAQGTTNFVADIYESNPTNYLTDHGALIWTGLVVNADSYTNLAVSLSISVGSTIDVVITNGAGGVGWIDLEY